MGQCKLLVSENFVTKQHIFATKRFLICSLCGQLQH